MLKSLSSCAWLGSRNPGPPQTILFLGLRKVLYSLTRQEMQCYMTPGRPKFLRQFLSFLPQNFIDSGGKIDQKRLKKISWMGKIHAHTLVVVLTFSSDASLTCAKVPDFGKRNPGDLVSWEFLFRPSAESNLHSRKP